MMGYVKSSLIVPIRLPGALFTSRLPRGAVVARQATQQRLDQVVHEAGEDAGGLGFVEVGDLVVPVLAADLVEHRLEAAGLTMQR